MIPNGNMHFRASRFGLSLQTNELTLENCNGIEKKLIIFILETFKGKFYQKRRNSYPIICKTDCDVACKKKKVSLMAGKMGRRT